MSEEWTDDELAELELLAEDEEPEYLVDEPETSAATVEEGLSETERAIAEADYLREQLAQQKALANRSAEDARAAQREAYEASRGIPAVDPGELAKRKAEERAAQQQGLATPLRANRNRGVRADRRQRHAPVYAGNRIRATDDVGEYEADVMTVHQNGAITDSYGNKLAAQQYTIVRGPGVGWTPSEES